MGMTVRLRSRMTLSQQHESEDRDRGQASWMGDDAVRWREAEKADLGGRVSGPEDWRAARDELGGDQKVAIPEHKGEQLSSLLQCLLENLLSLLETFSVADASVENPFGNSPRGPRLHPHQQTGPGRPYLSSGSDTSKSVVAYHP